jgi:hypothetical protein
MEYSTTPGTDNLSVSDSGYSSGVLLPNKLHQLRKKASLITRKLTIQ